MADLVSTENTWAARGFAVAAVLLLGTINIAGVKWVIKLQFVLLIVILLAALDFFLGSLTNIPGKYESTCMRLHNLNPHWQLFSVLLNCFETGC